VGGSLIVPNTIDTDFLKKFRKLILERIGRGDRFILVSGGGRTARIYQDAASKILKIDDEELDWLGIHSTRLNAHLLRTIFKKEANPHVVKDPEKDKIDFKESVLVGSGWKPGWSTDYISVLLAEKYGADSLINLSNIRHVYSEDPRENPLAEKHENLSWKEFRKIVGDKWIPGMSTPFDPIASKKAEKLDLKVVVIGGENLKSLENYLDGKKFEGTLIK